MNTDETIHGPKLDPQGLMDGLNDAITRAEPWARQVALADDTINCWWPNQTDDGKRRRPTEDAPEPFPWEGASDTRIRIIGQKCRELLALCNQALVRGQWKFTGVDGFDFIKAGKMTQLLKWQTRTQMGAGAERARILATKYAVNYGLGILNVSWGRKERVGLEAITQESVAEKFGVANLWAKYARQPEVLKAVAENNADKINPELLASIAKFFDLYRMFSDEPSDGYDPQKILADWLRELYPDANEAASMKAAKDLRETGEAEIPQKRVVKDCPVWQAYLPFEDIFFPVETSNLEEAQWIAVRKWCTRTEVESNEAWPKNFKEKLLEQEGASATSGLDDIRSKSRRWGSRKTGEFVRSSDRKGQYEVFEFYYPSVNEYGVECLKRSVFSFNVKNDAGKYIVAEDGIYDEGGDYPFYPLEFEPESDFLLDNEGFASRLYTYQAEIKACRDGRINYMDISILPPIRRNVRDRGRPLRVGPDRPVFESIPGSTGFMPPPESRTWVATEIESTVTKDINRFVGAPGEGVPESVVALLQGDFVSTYLKFMSTVLAATFRLDQLYMSEVQVMRVTGMLGQPFKVSRNEIQGSFDICITFDQREMDSEYSKAKAESLTKLVGLDVNGVIDRNKAVSLAVYTIDPDWAETLITDEQQGSMKEILDEQKNVALMMTGQEPPMTDSVNPRMRLQYLQSITMQSPDVKTKLAYDPFTKSLFENRAKHLLFLLQQQENAKIGRFGTKQIIQQ